MAAKSAAKKAHKPIKKSSKHGTKKAAAKSPAKSKVNSKAGVKTKSPKRPVAKSAKVPAKSAVKSKASKATKVSKKVAKKTKPAAKATPKVVAKSQVHKPQPVAKGKTQATVVAKAPGSPKPVAPKVAPKLEPKSESKPAALAVKATAPKPAPAKFVGVPQPAVSQTAVLPSPAAVLPSPPHADPVLTQPAKPLGRSGRYSTKTIIEIAEGKPPLRDRSREVNPTRPPLERPPRRETLVRMTPMGDTTIRRTQPRIARDEAYPVGVDMELEPRRPVRAEPVETKRKLPPPAPPPPANYTPPNYTTPGFAESGVPHWDETAEEHDLDEEIEGAEAANDEE